MDDRQVIEALAALAQPTRLRAFRDLVAVHPETLAAGEIARRCAVPHNTMSAHLAALSRAGLVTAERDSRSRRYAADLAGFQAVVGFLLSDCCGGRPEVCLPILQTMSETCACETECIDA